MNRIKELASFAFYLNIENIETLIHSANIIGLNQIEINKLKKEFIKILNSEKFADDWSSMTLEEKSDIGIC